MKKTKLKSKVAVGIILICILFSIKSARAEEINVTALSEVLYTGQNANVYATTDTSTSAITTLSANIPIQVTGVTSNGWYQVNVNGTYYMQANSLKAPTYVDGQIFTYTESEIKSLTAGTFSYFKTKELANYSMNDVMDMDDNTYLKYLDSYITGYGVLNDCVIRDAGLKLSEYVSLLISKDASYSAKSNREILIDYRIEFLDSSLEGPHRTEKSLELALTKAIRYNKATLTAEFKNASISDDEKKMDEIIEDAVDLIAKEQGITFTYTKEYKDEYWYITFTKK